VLKGSLGEGDIWISKRTAWKVQHFWKSSQPKRQTLQNNERSDPLVFHL